MSVVFLMGLVEEESLGQESAAMADKVLSESLPASVNDRTWGVLSALSSSAKQRSQGEHILLTLQEHVLGRSVKESGFQFDSPSVSGRHCKIYRRALEGQREFVVFLKDSSSNGTYLNGQRLRKETPEARIQHGDVISLAAPPELETAFTYVFRDTSSSCIKRKADEELSRNDDNKRLKSADGPVSLADVRRLERNNQELRQKLEHECNKCDSLNADLRASKSSTDLAVKEAVEQCKAEYCAKLTELQAEYAAKVAEFDECTGKCVQQLSVIEDLNKRLKALAESRAETEEALRIHKANREELEKQIEKERSQWKREREELESVHKFALERIRAECGEDLNRQAEAFSRTQTQLEDKLNALQEQVTEYRAQIDNLCRKLEEERETRMNIDKRGQELQIQLNSEQHVSVSLRQDLEKAKEDIQKEIEKLEICKEERNSANAKVVSLQLENEDILSQLKLERQRFEGAKDRIVLRETQLRAFQSTAEEIQALQQKQQEQLKAMMKTLEDDDAGYINAAGDDNDRHSGSKTIDHDEDMQDVEETKMEGTQELNNAEEVEKTPTLVEQHDDHKNNLETLPEGACDEGMATQLQLDATQVDATQLLPQIDSTQILPQLPSTVPVDPNGDDLPEEDGGAREDIQTQLAESPPRQSLCTKDLLTSEAAGSWVNETQEFAQPASTGQPREQNLLGGSQVGTSDEQIGVERNMRVSGEDTMGSQNSPNPKANILAGDTIESDGSDTEEE